VATTEIGVLVLSGSSGRIESERARLFAEQGMSALTIRWFATPRGPKDPGEVPIETFIEAIDLLRAEGARRIGIVGVSKGAEAALLTAIRDPRVDTVIAFSPTAYVWSWSTVGEPPRSSWTWRGAPLPFVPMDDAWAAERRHLEGPVAIRGWYEHSEHVFPEYRAAAAIPIEQTRAEIVLVAGGDDEQWPSLPFAEQLLERRKTPGAAGSGAPTHLVTHPDAGHRPRLPGESPAQPPTVFAYGGTHETDAELGAEAWPVILETLHRSAGKKSSPAGTPSTPSDAMPRRGPAA
jgi:dienelactone hydrolase